MMYPKQFKNSLKRISSLHFWLTKPQSHIWTRGIMDTNYQVTSETDKNVFTNFPILKNARNEFRKNCKKLFNSSAKKMLMLK